MIKRAVCRHLITIRVLALTFLSSTIINASPDITPQIKDINQVVTSQVFSHSQQQQLNIPQLKLPQIRLMIGGVAFTLEVALTETQIRAGLMGRTVMEEQEGMIFVFSNQRARAFSMDKCLFDLDALFLNAKGTIVAIQEMNRLSGSKTSKLYVGPSTTQYVIEVNQGIANRLGLYRGMQLALPDVIKDFTLIEKATTNFSKDHSRD